MKREPYLDAYVKLLEQSLARAQKDLERERKRVDFLEGKCERLELVVMSVKNEAGAEYVDRSDRAAAPPQKKPKITQVPVTTPARVPFREVREQWESLTEKQQEEALAQGNLEVKPKEVTA